MTRTIDLMEKALATKTAAEWARQLGISRQTFTDAKTRGKLSPSVAGALAMEIGEDWKKWALIAALETDYKSPCKKRLERAMGIEPTS